MDDDMTDLLTKLQIKAQLLGKVPLDQLDLKNTQEMITVGFLRAAMEATEALDKLEVLLDRILKENARLLEERERSPWEKAWRWLTQSS